MGTKHSDWIAAKSAGIGGSEITAVLGLDSYCTPYQLWERKTGRAPDFEGNEATRRGQLLEPAIVAWFEEKTDLKSKAIPPHTVIRHKQFPHLLGTPDRLVGRDGVLECKSTRKTITRENMPVTWFFQTQWYLGITGRERGFIAWIGGGLEFDHLEMEFDSSVFDSMVEQANAFWNDHVLADVAPGPVRPDDIQRIYTEVRPETVEADAELVVLHDRFCTNRRKIKELSEANDELGDALKMALLDKTVLAVGPRVLCTWKEQERTTLDLEAMEQAEPDTLERLRKDYTKRTKTRVLRVNE